MRSASALFATSALLLAGLALGQDLAPQRILQLDIASQPLGDALNELGRQAGLQVVLYSETGKGVVAPHVAGPLTAEQALSRLLDNTGLEYEFLSPQGVAIRERPVGSDGERRTSVTETVSADYLKLAKEDTAGSGAAMVSEAPPSSQSSPENASASSEPSEILVTAKRRASTATKFELPVIDTPQSIKAVTSDVLDFASIRQFTDLTKIDASTNQQGVYGGVPHITMRGFDNSSNNGIKVDGVPALNALPLDIGVFDRIEILKGPTSTLYGQNAVGGLINAVSKQPLSAFRGTLQAQSGSWSFRRIEGDVGGPALSDNSLLYRLYGAYEDGGQFIDFEKNKSKVAYGKLRYLVDPATSVSVGVDYQDRQYTPDYGIGVLANTLTVPDVPATRYYSVPWAHRDTSYIQATADVAHELSSGWVLKATSRYDNANAAGTDASSFGLFNDAGYSVFPGATPFPLTGDFSEVVQRQWSFEVSLTGSFTLLGRDNTFYLGIDDRKLDANNAWACSSNLGMLNIYNPDYSALASPRPHLSDWAVDYADCGSEISNARTSVRGATGQVLLHPFDRVSVLMGARLDKTSVDTRSWGGSIAGNDFVKVGTPTLSSLDSSKVVPQVGITFELKKNVNAYATWGESFTPQQGLVYPGVQVDPEEGYQYEAGVKANIRNLTATMAVFDMKRTHIVGGDFAHPQFISQIGSQESRGAELDVFGAIVAGWTLYGSYAYIDGHITDTVNTADIDARMFGVPRNALSLYSYYQLQEGSLKGLGFGGGVVSKQDIVWGLASVPVLGRQVDAGGYTTADARVFYELQHVRFDLKVNNVFDKK